MKTKTLDDFKEYTEINDAVQALEQRSRKSMPGSIKLLLSSTNLRSSSSK
jgi:hypothetical protein